MVLVFNNFTPPDRESMRRQNEAWRTWKFLNATLFCFAPKRTSEIFGDRRAMPFVRDMIEGANSTGDELIGIVNNDIKLGAGIGDCVRKHCSEFGCYWAYRIPSAGQPTDGGADFFAFTKRWWIDHGTLFPDLLFGYRWWDAVLVRMMFHYGCPEGPRLYFHEPHTGVSARNHTPGAVYNERLGNEWCGKYGASMPLP